MHGRGRCRAPRRRGPAQTAPILRVPAPGTRPEFRALPHAAPGVQRAAQWLLARQRADGGWGEDGATYWEGHPKGEGAVSTASQTAWALLGLMAAGKGNHPALARGVEYLLAARDADGLWSEEPFTAVGFPRVFYLKYHGYAASFPLWALARYRAFRA